MKTFGTRAWLRVAALPAAGMALSGCVYDVGLGYASDGYYSDYGCDPYSPFDSYYDCDFGYGFSNIGFGGGWYDSFWYPGHGFYLFDSYGHRHPMRDNHRRYWGERRHDWYRENGGRPGSGGRYQGRGRSYDGNATPGAIGWPENNGGRVREGDTNRRGRGEGRRGRNEQWRGGTGTGANAVPTPNTQVVQDGDRDQRGDEGPRGEGRRSGRGNDGANSMPMRQRSATPSETPAHRPSPQPRPERARQQIPRNRVSEGGVEQPQ